MRRFFLIFFSVLFLASYSYAEVQNIKVSGGVINTFVSLTHFELSEDSVLDDYQILSQAHVCFEADLTDSIDFTFHILNQSDYGKTNQDGVALLYAFATVNNFLSLPVSLTIGRQPYMIGDGLLLGDARPNHVVESMSYGMNPSSADLSNPWYCLFDGFDGLSVACPLDAFTVKGFIFRQGIYNSDYTISVDEDEHTIENDNYLFGSEVLFNIASHSLELYFLHNFNDYSVTGSPITAMDDMEVSYIGAIVNIKGFHAAFVNISLQGELSYMFGDKNMYSTTATDFETDIDVSSLAFNIDSIFNIGSSFSVRASVDYRKGQDADDDDHTGWFAPYYSRSVGSLFTQLYVNETSSLREDNPGLLAYTVGVVYVPISSLSFGFDFIFGQSAQDIVSNIDTNEPDAEDPLDDSDQLGTEMDFSAVYTYSDNLSFRGLVAILKSDDALANWNSTSSANPEEDTVTEILLSANLSF
jgi:hypothetical protein